MNWLVFAVELTTLNLVVLDNKHFLLLRVSDGLSGTSGLFGVMASLLF
jgi:hypothetical protein